MAPNGATTMDMHPVPLLAAVGLLLGTAAGVFVGLPCCGVTLVEAEGLVLGVGDGLGDGLVVGCAGTAGAVVGTETVGAEETCE
jgi:hypothetical protein